DLFYDRGDYARALENYRRAIAVLPRGFEVLIQAGNSARFLGDAAGAAEYYATAGRVRPDSWVPPYNTACLRAVNGDPQAALSLLGDAMALGFASPQLLERNEDFDPVRPLPGWPDLLGGVRDKAAGGGAQWPQLPARAG